jgi:hypothetical protein
MWTSVASLCKGLDLNLSPETIHFDFEVAMHNVLRDHRRLLVHEKIIIPVSLSLCNTNDSSLFVLISLSIASCTSSLDLGKGGSSLSEDFRYRFHKTLKNVPTSLAKQL